MGEISLNKVFKKYKIGRPKKIIEALPSFFSSHRLKEFWALRGVSLHVDKGDTLGIIGPNGSGKSTLLRIMAGVTNPTKGRVSVTGRVCSILELGSGFHPELTGRENIYLHGAVLGIHPREIDKKFKEIVDFADLWDFIDTPIKHYSSGMQVRLGFAVSVNAEPDVLLIDEALAVGDASFQQKSLEKMTEYKNKGVTIVLVTHNLDQIRDFCDKAVLLIGGKLKGIGTPEEVLRQYENFRKRQIDSTS